MQLGKGAVMAVLGLMMASGESPFVVLWASQCRRAHNAGATRLTISCSWPGLGLQKGLRTHAVGVH